MPLRIFSRSSPKKTANNSADASEPSGRDAFRPPLFPLQEVPWNSFTDGKNDLLSTPRDAMKWLSSTPLPDPPFFESQENFPSVSPEKAPLSEQSNLKAKTARESKLRPPNQLDAECTTVSSRSSASSAGMLDTCPGNYYSEHRNAYATPQTSSCDPDTGLVAGITPVARSLKYGPGSNAQIGSCTVHAPIPNSCAQLHFEIEEDPTFWKDHNVQVVIRLRPLNSSELATQGQSRCVRQDSAHALTWTGHPESRFTFDIVACESITQEKIFKVAGQPMVDNCLAGYNSCMFAYGQTGSGKTYTMLGDLEDADHRPSNDRGMTPRVFEYLFARIDQEEEARAHERLKFVCKCSFLEIYNEQILDLLEPSNANLQMREDARKGVYVENLLEVEAKNVQDVIGLLLQGAANRKVAATNMNRESSRSHSVFTCVIESKWINQSVTNSRYGRLNLVDLAGSERQKSSGAEGERLKEAANINKSLSTLGLVIMSLVDIANGKQRHVPYRDSKLTFLLHDSLGGNSKTTIIANISPSNCCAMETLSTLKFAQRAKFIRNNAIINENNSGDVMALRLQIQRLKQEINRLRLQGAMVHGGVEMLPEGVLGSDVNGLELSNISHSTYSLEAWDSLKALASPTFSSKKRKELEYALSGSLRREQAGEARIRQLHAEIEQFKRLVKQREEDSQCGKMMLRFREDKIKRLEAALGGVISTDAYLMEERNSLLEEVNILRTRLERNPEVTRFAMENIRLLEELRRFQDFYEAGERDMMAEEISILRDQLLEALDWKLMHEQDSGSLENAQPIDSDCGNKESDLLQLEVDRSRLEKQIETVEAVASMQAELIAMREAVAAATKGEFEARERVSLLTGEIEALQKGLKELHDENARLCGMYQSALSEKDALIKEFKNEWNMTKEEKEGQINELRIALQHAEKTLHAVSHHKEEEPGIHNAHKNLEEENAKLCNMVEKADSEKEVEIYSLKNALQAAEETIRIMALSNKSTDSQDGEKMKRNVDPYHLDSVSPSSRHAVDGAMLHDKDKCEESLEDTHARASEIEVLLKELQDLQDENARISATYQSAQSEKSSTEVEFHLFHQTVMEGKDAEIQELRSALQAAQLSLSNLKDSAPPSSQCAVDGGMFHDKDKGQESLEDTHARASEIEVLLKELKDSQDDNARISAIYQSALAEKSSTEVELHLFHQIEMEGKEAEIQELRNALQSAQLSLSNLKLQEKENEENDQIVCQELTSLLRCVENLTSLLQVIDGTVSGMMQWIERSTDGIKHLFEKVMASTSEFKLERDSLETAVDRIVSQMLAMLLDMDESEQKVQAICTDLEHTRIRLQEAEQKAHDLCMGLEDTKLRLKDAEQARDDVCLLSSVEKSTWMQDQKVLQERLDDARRLLSSKDKMLQDGISDAESKLELLEAKITELSTIVDKKMLYSSNQIFWNLDTSRDSSSGILKIESDDEEEVENSLNMVQFKLKQAENKVNAIKLVLNRLSSAKRAWFSREERLHEHLQNLNNVVLEKEAEVNNLEGEKEKLVLCLDELLKEEELTLLESENLKERLQVSEEGIFELATGQTSMSMLQLLRGQEEKATLRSVVDSLHEKLETVRADIEQLRGQIDKIDTALMFSQVDLEAAISTLQEAEAEMEETKKEKEALLEAEAEGSAEFELLTAEYKKVADEERELEEQMKGYKSKSSLHELKENQMLVAHSKFAEDKADAADCSKEESGMLAEYVVDIKEFLLDVKLSFENLGKIVDHVKES